MAVADELHAATPDGKAYLGISLREFDVAHHAWVIEYLNVTNSFLRRQVSPHSGSVRQEGDAVVVTSVDGAMQFRESYTLTDKNHFTYTADTSHDEGHTWDTKSIEISMARVE
jgi:hypothetical protein